MLQQNYLSITTHFLFSSIKFHNCFLGFSKLLNYKCQKLRLGNKHPDITTIGIGDGGNEVGMGKVCEKVISTVPHGKEIATEVSCDYLVTCGVSNWGGLALAVGLYALRQCPVHKRFCQNGIVHQNDCVSKVAFIPNEEKVNISLKTVDFYVNHYVTTTITF